MESAHWKGALRSGFEWPSLTRAVASSPSVPMMMRHSASLSCLCREIEAYGVEPNHPCGVPSRDFETALACCESACRSCLPNFEAHFCDQDTCEQELSTRAQN